MKNERFFDVDVWHALHRFDRNTDRSTRIVAASLQSVSAARDAKGSRACRQENGLHRGMENRQEHDSDAAQACANPDWLPPADQIFQHGGRVVDAAARDAENLADDLILPQFFVHCNTVTQLFSRESFLCFARLARWFLLKLLSGPSRAVRRSG